MAVRKRTMNGIRVAPEEEGCASLGATEDAPSPLEDPSDPTCTATSTRKAVEQILDAGSYFSDLTRAPLVQWQWRHRSGWRNYTEPMCFRIEKAYRRGDPYVRLKSGKGGTIPMEIFFTEMIQHDPVTGNVRAIRRRDGVSCWAKWSRKLMQWKHAVESGVRKQELFADYRKQSQALIDAIDEPGLALSFYWKPAEESCCSGVVQSHYFANATLLLVLANAAWIGIDAEYNDADTVLDAEPIFQVVEHCFCSLFFLELLLRCGAYRHLRDVWYDTWLLFDGSLVLLMILEVWIFSVIQVLSGNTDSSELNGFSVFSIARLLRLARLGRVARLVRMVPEVMTLLKGITTAVRSVFLTLLLLFIMLFMFGIFFKSQSEENATLNEIFPTLRAAVWALLLHGVFLDSVAMELNKIADESYILSSVFIFFVIAASYTVMNLLIGILCDVVHQVSAHEKDEMAVNYLKAHLLDILEVHDKDDDRHIIASEFDLLMKNPEIHLQLTKFGVDVGDLIALKDVLFDSRSKILHSPGTFAQGAGVISFGAFLQVVLRLRGGNTAKVKDIVELREFIKQQLERFEGIVRRLITNPSAPLGYMPDQGLSMARCHEALAAQKEKDATVQRLLAELRAGHRELREELQSIKAALGDVQRRKGTEGAGGVGRSLSRVRWDPDDEVYQQLEMIT